MCLLDAHELTHRFVVFGIGNGRLIEDVVLITPPVELLAKRIEPRANVLIGHGALPLDTVGAGFGGV
jgi:hypothetical protein